MSAPDLVVFGHLLTDDVVFEDGRTRFGEPGGAALYFGLAAALWRVQVGIVTLRDRDYPRAALELLAQRGVALEGVRTIDGPGVRNWLLYEGPIRHLVHHLASPPLAAVTPRVTDLPPHWLGARAFHVAPMPYEIQLEIAGDLAKITQAQLSLDPYLLLTEETWEIGQRLAGAGDLFFLSADELLVPHDRGDPRSTLDRLWGGRTSVLALKQGRDGGCWRDADGWHRWPPRHDGVVDTTGGGDAFAAGYLAGWLAGDTAERCVQRGIVTASFAIAGWGIGGLLAATPERAEKRLGDWFPA